ncbi:MAG: hypothetical protein JW395_0678 [Nitrospira sp.]|nr:hypothetical protein [Nitrospira sp.]
MINIVSTFYIPKKLSRSNNFFTSQYSSYLNKLRITELETCLLNNISSQYVDTIHLFVEDDDALSRINEISNKSKKVVIAEVGKQPTYVDFFNYIASNLNDKVCMITNADIFVHETNNALVDTLQSNKLAYALTRHEHNMSHPEIDDYGGSHDAYIFNSKFLDHTIINEHTDFYQHFPGIESHIIKALCDIGFKVLNPCKQIQIVHLHKSQVRNHGKWIGLHKYGDNAFHRKSCWWVPPVVL